MVLWGSMVSYPRDSLFSSLLLLYIVYYYSVEWNDYVQVIDSGRDAEVFPHYEQEIFDHHYQQHRQHVSTSHDTSRRWTVDDDDV